MRYVSKWSMISMAVKQANMPAVYIYNGLNYDDDSSVWDYVCEKIKDPATLSNLVHGGLFFFDDMKDAEDFFEKFNRGPVYASAIYAMLMDNTGDILTENT